MTVNDSPCLGCERRTLTCHDTCGPYLDYRAKQKQIAQNRNSYVAACAYDRDLHCKRMRDFERLHKRGKRRG